MATVTWQTVRIDLPCPGCGHKNSEVAGNLIDKDSIPCRACDEVIDISDDEWQTAFKKIADGHSELSAPASKGH